ncbi:ferric reductase like protein [Kushneria sinocarnis]|uniref:Ferric reductase like protein n=1 Tax=Kushneria sinocarnis TaxID=595502 RepID=A0A420WZ06_9GAMM|nr:ferric reductase like protein [Kushneria sinocarnis]
MAGCGLFRSAGAAALVGVAGGEQRRRPRAGALSAAQSGGGRTDPAAADPLSDTADAADPLEGFSVIRRQLGLWTCSYAVLHLVCYLLFILELNWSALGADLSRRPYIIVGALALLILLTLAATSNRAAMKRLGKRWKPLHRWVYAALALILLHFFWIVRADLGQWGGYALAATTLMLLRLPPVSRRLSRLGRRRPTPRPSPGPFDP